MSKEKDSSNIDGMNGLERSLKRVGDFVGALFLLIVLSPVFLYIYIRQRWNASGPVIYSQERIGKGGKPFMIYKFRTMVVDAEKDGVPQLEQKTDSYFPAKALSKPSSRMLLERTMYGSWP